MGACLNKPGGDVAGPGTPSSKVDHHHDPATEKQASSKSTGEDSSSEKKDSPESSDESSEAASAELCLVSSVPDEPRERSTVEVVIAHAIPPSPEKDMKETPRSRPTSLRWSLRKHESKDDKEPSSPNTPTSPLKPRRQSRCTHHPLAHEHVRDVVTHILGQKKDQDRAVCVPALLPGVLYCGVFDGHGRDGETRSELATTELPKLIKRELGKVIDQGREITEKDVHDALDVSYAEFHNMLDKMYEETVYKRAVEEATMRSRTEQGSDNNDEVTHPVRMPQDGGTTATSVIVTGELVVVGWVGDSRAVLARRIAKKRGPILQRFSSRLKISTLTEDHNVAANLDEEMQRVAEQGGEIYGKHLAAGAVEGMLQLTRSLGDSPFHRTGLVVSKPGIITVPMVDDNVDPLLFLLVASDGLWDHFSNKEALSFVYKRLKKDGYADETNPAKRSMMLADCARALEQEAIKRSTERRSHSDDITVLLLTFSRGWSIEAEDSPSF